jgi:hypothetical protein
MTVLSQMQLPKMQQIRPWTVLWRLSGVIYIHVERSISVLIYDFWTYGDGWILDKHRSYTYVSWKQLILRVGGCAPIQLYLHFAHAVSVILGAEMFQNPKAGFQDSLLK